MGWAVVTLQSKVAPSTGTGVRAGLRQNKGGSRLYLNFTLGFASKQGWRDGDNMHVMVGTEDMQGLVRIRKDELGELGDKAIKLIERRAKKTYFIVDLGYWEQFDGAGTQPAEWCKHDKVPGDFVEIVLPAWSSKKKATPPSTVSGSVSPPTIQTEVKRPYDKARLPPVVPPREKRDSLTASLMGDPPKGRKEMLAALDQVGRKVAKE